YQPVGSAVLVVLPEVFESVLKVSVGIAASSVVNEIEPVPVSGFAGCIFSFELPAVASANRPSCASETIGCRKIKPATSNASRSLLTSRLGLVRKCDIEV